jgi:hypothetical protein
MRGLMISALLGAAIQVTSRSASRYVVTAEPLAVGSSAKLCVAVDGTDPHGVWWWQPGRDGCLSRSTGPTVLKADSATVSKSDAKIEASFRLRLHGSATRPDHVDVRIVVERGRMRSQAPNSDVAVAFRNDLEVPYR